MAHQISNAMTMTLQNIFNLKRGSYLSTQFEFLFISYPVPRELDDAHEGASKAGVLKLFQGVVNWSR